MPNRQETCLEEKKSAESKRLLNTIINVPTEPKPPTSAAWGGGRESHTYIDFYLGALSRAADPRQTLGSDLVGQPR